MVDDLENYFITTYKKRRALKLEVLRFNLFLILDVCFLLFFDEEVETTFQSSLIQYICKKIFVILLMLKSGFGGSDSSIHCILPSLFFTGAKMTLQKYICTKNPGYVIKPIIGDGYCVILSFQEGLSFCYDKVKILDSLFVKLRREIMKSFDFYSKFSTKDVNVLLELNSFLK